MMGTMRRLLTVLMAACAALLLFATPPADAAPTPWFANQVGDFFPCVIVEQQATKHRLFCLGRMRRYPQPGQGLGIGWRGEIIVFGHGRLHWQLGRGARFGGWILEPLAGLVTGLPLEPATRPHGRSVFCYNARPARPEAFSTHHVMRKCSRILPAWWNWYTQQT